MDVDICLNMQSIILLTYFRSYSKGSEKFWLKLKKVLKSIIG